MMIPSSQNIQTVFGANGDEHTLVFANLIFVESSGVTITNKEGQVSEESLAINRDDFLASRSKCRSHGLSLNEKAGETIC